MNRFRIFGLMIVLAAVLAMAAPTPATAYVSASVNVSFFYDSLAPYGQWVSNPSYGYVWRPTHISVGWRPYMNGRWLYTTAGWSFDSYEPWGWATFHYGRWMYDPYYGWIWVPGTEWSPAWVDFQIGDGWIGWAAMPPGVNIYASYGGYRSRIDPRGYCFVEDRRFLDSRVDRYIAPWSSNTRYLRTSRDATRFSSYSGMVVNTGLPVDRIERRIRRAVPRVPIVDVASYQEISSRRDRGFAVYRPNVRARADHRPAVVYPSVAERRTSRVPAQFDTRHGRNREVVSTKRPPVRTLESRQPQRNVVQARRVETHAQRQVTSSRRVEARPRHQDIRVRTVEPRAQKQVVRREVKTVHKNTVSQGPRASQRVVHQSARARQQPQRNVRSRDTRPPRQQAQAAKKQHGNGRPPHGG